MAKQLLVIDQNLAVHRLLEFTLSKEGFQITAVEDGLAGLDAAYQQQPDLIMVTSQLEGLPLPRFIQKVREREALRATPIILMAQPAEPLEQTRQSGVTDVIKKPLDAMELNAIITRCLPAAKPVGARAEASQPSAGSTEDDQEMAQMEEMLGWVPQERSSAKPAPASPAPPAAAAMGDESDLPFELQTQAPKRVVEPVTVREEAVSLEDLLITGADAINFEPPASPPPPPPPPPEPEPTPLDELIAAQEPIPVSKSSERSERSIGRPPAAPSPKSRPAPVAPPPPAGASPLPGGLTRQEAEALIRSTVEELTRTVARETIERLAKEIVPELAEREVQTEIDRLKADAPAD